MLNRYLGALPLPAYATDAAGCITFCNDAMAELWGGRPEIGADESEAPWQLFRSDGTPLPPDQHPAARARAGRRSIEGGEIVAERPDGSRLTVRPYVTPLLDEAGTLLGVVNLLVDVSAHKQSEHDARRLAAIVESSDDAILAKDLDGTILSWNVGAERLFGYAAEEVIGKPVTILMPAERLDEESEILSRIRRGERVNHYETVRRRKDGCLVDISLTVSPLMDADGRIMGASKIARDITERRRAEGQQRLLLDEMNHRVKNALMLASSLVAMSARTATSVPNLARDLRDRLDALARAHALTLPGRLDPDALAQRTTSLHTLIRTIVAPFDATGGDRSGRMRVGGPDLPVAPGAPVTSLALLLHEFATNAAKYGALSSADGWIQIDCSESPDHFILVWTERGGPPVKPLVDSAAEGFGSLLARATVKGQLDGEIVRDWRPEGLAIRLTVARGRVTG